MSRRVGRPYKNLKTQDEYRKLSQNIGKRVRRIEAAGKDVSNQGARLYRELMDEVRQSGGFGKGSERDRARWSNRIDEINEMKTTSVAGAKDAHRNQLNLFSTKPRLPEGKSVSVDPELVTVLRPEETQDSAPSVQDVYKEMSHDQRTAVWKTVTKAVKAKAKAMKKKMPDSDVLVALVEAMYDNFNNRLEFDINDDGDMSLRNNIELDEHYNLIEDVKALRRETKAIESKPGDMKPTEFDIEELYF